jgi:acyl dehydratase
VLELTIAELATTTELDVGASDWVEIDQQRIDAFAAATGDRQWIHTDPERAATGPFGSTIAHGYLTLALLPQLLGTMLRITDAAMGVNYGIDRLRLTAPVPVGSRVRAHGRITRVEPKAAGHLYGMDVTVEIEGEERPAMVGTVRYLVLP